MARNSLWLVCKVPSHLSLKIPSNFNYSVLFLYSSAPGHSCAWHRCYTVRHETGICLVSEHQSSFVPRNILLVQTHSGTDHCRNVFLNEERGHLSETHYKEEKRPIKINCTDIVLPKPRQQTSKAESILMLSLQGQNI